MSDTSISGLPEQATPADGDLMVLVDIDAEVGSKTSKISFAQLAEALRDYLEGLDNAIHGSLYIDDGAVSQAVTGSAWNKITGFTAGNYDRVTLGTDQMTIQDAGGYDVGVALSWQGGNSVTFEVCLFVNGVEQPQVEFWRKMGVAGDVGSGSARNIVHLAAGDVIDVRIYPDADGNIVVRSGQLSLHRVF